MKIPHQQLSPHTLHSLIEEFITRNGTDYGENEIPLEQKVHQVMRQLEREDAVIVYDPGSETCTILSAADAQKFELAANTEYSPTE